MRKGERGWESVVMEFVADRMRRAKMELKLTTCYKVVIRWVDGVRKKEDERIDGQMVRKKEVEKWMN